MNAVVKGMILSISWCVIPVLLLTIFISPGLSAVKPAFHYSNESVDCDNPLSFPVGISEVCSHFCPNRDVNIYGSGSHILSFNCALKDCPKDMPLRSKDGSCYACDEKNGLNDIENCAVCQNRYEESEKCLLMSDPDEEETLEDTDESMRVGDEEEKIYAPSGGPCPPEKPLRSAYDICYSCDNDSTILLDSLCNQDNNCEAACPNRVIVRSMGGSPSSMLKCPADRPLIDAQEMCWSCDEEVDIDVEFNEEKCDRYCAGKRYLFLNRCIKCPVNRETLKYDACLQCNGEWKDGRCF